MCKIKAPKSERKLRQSDLDMDKLAYAVAMAETKDCTLGYGKTHNNCFGIKHGNTVPCPGVAKLSMCRFESKEASYEAFKLFGVLGTKIIQTTLLLINGLDETGSETGGIR